MPKLGVNSPINEHQNLDRTLVGIPFQSFMTYLCKDQEMIQYRNVKKVFQVFDQDKNGMITESDIEQLLNPTCFDRELPKQMFKEVSLILKTDVSFTGISMTDFRNVLLYEMKTKRNKLTQFMESNKSMNLIKECRELARLNHKADALKKSTQPGVKP